MHLRIIKTPSISNPRLCILRLGAIGGRIGASSILQTLNRLLANNNMKIIDQIFPIINQILKIQLSDVPNALAYLVQNLRLINDSDTHDTKPYQHTTLFIT